MTKPNSGALWTAPSARSLPCISTHAGLPISQWLPVARSTGPTVGRVDHDTSTGPREAKAKRERNSEITMAQPNCKGLKSPDRRCSAWSGGKPETTPHAVGFALNPVDRTGSRVFRVRVETIKTPKAGSRAGQKWRIWQERWCVCTSREVVIASDVPDRFCTDLPKLPKRRFTVGQLRETFAKLNNGGAAFQNSNPTHTSRARLDDLLRVNLCLTVVFRGQRPVRDPLWYRTHPNVRMNSMPFGMLQRLSVVDVPCTRSIIPAG